MPNPLALVPILNTGLYRPDLTGTIARTVHFAEAGVARVRNFSTRSMQSTLEPPSPQWTRFYPSSRKPAYQEATIGFQPNCIAFTGTAP